MNLLEIFIHLKDSSYNNNKKSPFYFWQSSINYKYAKLLLLFFFWLRINGRYANAIVRVPFQKDARLTGHRFE